MPAPSRAAVIKLGALFGLFTSFIVLLLLVSGPHLSVTAKLLLALLLTGFVAAGFWVLLRLFRSERAGGSGSDSDGN